MIREWRPHGRNRVAAYASLLVVLLVALALVARGLSDEGLLGVVIAAWAIWQLGILTETGWIALPISRRLRRSEQEDRVARVARVPLSEPALLTGCLRCVTWYEEEVDSCDRCDGREILTLDSVERQLARSAAPDEDFDPGGFDLVFLCETGTVDEADMVRSRLVEEEIPHLMLDESAETRIVGRTGNVMAFLVPEDDYSWARRAIADLWESETSTWLVRAGGDAEAAMIRGRLESSGIRFVTSFLSRQFPFSSSKNAEIRFQVLQRDHESAVASIADAEEDWRSAPHLEHEPGQDAAGPDPATLEALLEGHPEGTNLAMRRRQRFCRAYIAIPVFVSSIAFLAYLATPLFIAGSAGLLVNAVLVVLVLRSRNAPEESFKLIAIIGLPFWILASFGGIPLPFAGYALLASFLGWWEASRMAPG